MELGRRRKDPKSLFECKLIKHHKNIYTMMTILHRSSLYFLLSIHFYNFQNEDPPISRICYNSMKHIEGDVVKPRDCIVLASGHRKRDLPFIAKVTSLWENPEDGK